MDVHTAAALIESAVPRVAATWADLGAGSGTFTIALASLLGPPGRVIALDRDTAALTELRSAIKEAALEDVVVARRGDFLKPLELPPLDGVLLANALHFVPTVDQATVLARVVALLRPHGRLLVVDYDNRPANPWVPFPVSSRRLAEMSTALGLSTPTLVGSLPSRYGGRIYAALARTPAPVR